MKSIVNCIIKIVLGIFFVLSVALAYYPMPEYLVEMTCISNTLAGILLITDGSMGMLKKKFKFQDLYLILFVGLFLVFSICMGSLGGAYHMNFKGAFFFLHVTNPIAFFLVYFFNVNEAGKSIKKCFAVPVFGMAYVLFDFIIGKVRGTFVYGFVKPEDMGAFETIITAIVLYNVFYLCGAAAFALNRKMRAWKYTGETK